VAGIEPVVSTTIDAVVARTAAVHAAAAIPDVLPCGLATGQFLETDLAPDPAPVQGGSIRVPQSTGLGVDQSHVL
jgi:L-alanine-DL-glutamate epimerase-like enolase superfamily enzyme